MLHIQKRIALLIGLLCLLAAQSLSAKKLIVYYSHTGTTRQIAMALQEETGADVLELVPRKAYNESYAKTVIQVKKQQLKNQLPVLKPYNVQLELYDTIYLGFPNWFAKPALPVQTFLKQHSLQGKHIIPFCSYGIGGMNSCIKFIKTSNPQAHVHEPLGISRNQVESTKERVQQFVNGVHLVGGYSALRPLTEEDRQLFEEAISTKKRRLKYEPQLVCTQVVAGINYRFECIGTNAQGEKKKYQIQIFKPLPGHGNAEVTSIERKL